MKIIFFVVLFLVIIILGLLLYIVISSRQQKLQNHDYNLIGTVAVVETDLDPSGLILVFGEAWQAISSVKVLKGTKVKVVATEGVFLKVEPILPKILAKKS